MATRLELQSKLEDLLGSSNVYYQPPMNLTMKYPAIRYSKSKHEKDLADDTTYQLHTRYDITVIDRRPDNPVIQKLLELPYCSYDRSYSADNLNHDTLTLYF